MWEDLFQGERFFRGVGRRKAGFCLSGGREGGGRGEGRHSFREVGVD